MDATESVSPLSPEEQVAIFGPDEHTGMTFAGVEITSNPKKDDWLWWEFLDSQAAHEWLQGERLRLIQGSSALLSWSASLDAQTSSSPAPAPEPEGDDPSASGTPEQLLP